MGYENIHEDEMSGKIMYTSEFQVELILELGFSFNGSKGKKGG